MHTQCGNWDFYRGLGCLNHFRSCLSYNKRHLNSSPEQIKKNSFSSSSFSEKTRCGRCWETIRVKAGRFIQKYLLNFVIGIVWAQTIIWIFIIVWIIIIWISSLGKRKKKKFVDNYEFMFQYGYYLCLLVLMKQTQKSLKYSQQWFNSIKKLEKIVP